jgi:sec-independent protein translocase protein TatA
MIPHFGPLELIIILVIVTMLFGVGKLPEVFGAVGRGIREFRKNSTVEEEKAIAVGNPTRLALVRGQPGCCVQHQRQPVRPRLACLHAVEALQNV